MGNASRCHETRSSVCGPRQDGRCHSIKDEGGREWGRMFFVWSLSLLLSSFFFTSPQLWPTSEFFGRKFSKYQNMMPSSGPKSKSFEPDPTWESGFFMNQILRLCIRCTAVTFFFSRLIFTRVGVPLGILRGRAVGARLRLVVLLFLTWPDLRVGFFYESDFATLHPLHSRNFFFSLFILTRVGVPLGALRGSAVLNLQGCCGCPITSRGAALSNLTRPKSRVFLWIRFCDFASVAQP